MAKLNDFKKLVDQKTEHMGNDRFKVKGQIGIKAGIMFAAIDNDTPDNPAQINALRAAIKEVLGIDA